MYGTRSFQRPTSMTRVMCSFLSFALTLASRWKRCWKSSVPDLAL